MKRLLILFFLISYTKALYSQEIIDTVVIYEYETAWSNNIINFIDGKLVSSKKFDQIYLTDSLNDETKELKENQYLCIEERSIKDNILKKYFQTHLESSMFGPYEEYFKNGGIKIKGQFSFTKKDTSGKIIDYGGVPNGKWEFYNKNGQLLYTKEYKNGFAHGEWIKYDKKENKLIIQKYQNGYAHGNWEYNSFRRNSSRGSRKTYQNGIIIYDDSFHDYSFTCKEFGLELFYEHVDQSKYSLNYTDIIYVYNGTAYLLKDGIQITKNTFKNGFLVNRIQYDY